MIKIQPQLPLVQSEQPKKQFQVVRMEDLAEGQKLTELIQRFWGKVIRKGSDECWLWTAGTNGSGYGAMYISRKQILAHRFSYLIANGWIDDRLTLHSCDTPPCVNPKHLRLGTQLNNIHDAIKRRRMLVGEKNGSAKLTYAEVGEIRALCRQLGVFQKDVAVRFGVCKMTISLITRMKIWN